MAINTSALTQYTEEHRIPLLRNAVIGSKTAKLFNLQTGVKGSTALNLLNTSIQFGDGSTCGWNEAGTASLSQRVITPGYPKVNLSLCDKQLLKYWGNYEVRVAAGQKTLPFEEDFMNGIVEGVAAALEKAIWQGDTGSGDVNLNKFDGIVKIAGSATVAATTVYNASSISTTLNAMYAALPSAAFQKGEVVAYISDADYRKYIQELIANGNLVITNGVNDVAMPESVLIPGTNVRVYGVAGLDGVQKAYMSYKDNFVFGTDLEGDEEKFEMWYSQDNREFRVAIEFTAGVQVAFPDMLVVAQVG